MSVTENASVARLAAALADRGGLKLWSVIVTILGDMAEGGYPEMPGPVLSSLIEEMGLQPQAMRVALHRLRKDGWVDTRRAARIGYYGLTPHGAAETRKVSSRVYGAAPTRRPVLAVLAPGVATPEGGVSLARQSVLLDPERVPKDALSAPLPERFPAWVTERLNEESVAQDYDWLLDVLNEIRDLPDDPFTALTMRFVVLHGWRRLVLRSNPLAEAALGPASSAARCRDRVGDILAKLPRVDPLHLA